MRSAHIDGRLGGDPEIFAPQGSDSTCLKFNIANDDESIKKQDGSGYENVTSWYSVKFWTKNPQHWIQKLVKGCKVICECDIKQETWEKDGKQNSRIIFNIKHGTYPQVIPNQQQYQEQQAVPQQQQQPPKEWNPNGSSATNWPAQATTAGEVALPLF